MIAPDGSADAATILERVVAFGPLTESTHTLLRVVEPSRCVGYDALSCAAGRAIAAEVQAEHAVTAYMDQVADGLRRQGAQVETPVMDAQQAAGGFSLLPRRMAWT